MGGYEEESGKFVWEDGSVAEYQNFEPYYGLEYSGTGGQLISWFQDGDMTLCR